MNFKFEQRKNIINQGKKYIRENLDPKLIKKVHITNFTLVKWRLKVENWYSFNKNAIVF